MDNNFKINMLLLNKELRLLLEILKSKNDNFINLNNPELYKKIDWEIFLQLAFYHRMYPLIYSGMKSINEKLIPPYVVKTLHQEYQKNTFQMLYLSGEMEQISKVFTENKIDLLFLKGPVIAEDIYGDISLRTSKDLDILIPKNDLKRAEEILLENGYKREDIPLSESLNWRWMNHHVTYFHSQKRIQIEIHWRLHPAPMKEPSFDELWERKRTSILTSFPVYFLGEEDLFLYLIAHGARHGWFRLRWLIDIDQMVRKRISLKRNNLLLKKYQYYHLGKQANNLGGQALLLVSQLLNTPINKEMQKVTLANRSRSLAQMAVFYINEMSFLHNSTATDDLVKFNNRSQIKSYLQKFFLVNRYLFLLKPNRIQKFLFIIRICFFPSSKDIETLKLPKPLNLLYFPLRPFLLAWRKTRKL